jgi:hypothetical protein
MLKIRMYARALVVFLFSTVLRVCRSSPLIKRVARGLLRFFPKLAQFYMRLMTRPAPTYSQRMLVPNVTQRTLTPNAAVILSDLKAAITQRETKIDKAPQSKGR